MLDQQSYYLGIEIGLRTGAVIAEQAGYRGVAAAIAAKANWTKTRAEEIAREDATPASPGTDAGSSGTELKTDEP